MSQFPPGGNRRLTAAPLPTAGLTALSQPPVVIAQGTTAKVVPLINYFCTADGSPAAVHYAITGDSNPSLFASPPSTVLPDELLLRLAPDASGTAELTVQGASAAGQSAQTVLTVQVSASVAATTRSIAVTTSASGRTADNQSGADTPPGPVSSVDVVAGATRIVPVDYNFQTPGQPAGGLSYRIAADSNPALFAAPPQIAMPGLLVMRAAAGADGTASDCTLTVNVMPGGGGPQALTVAIGPQPPYTGAAAAWNAAATFASLADVSPGAGIITTIAGNFAAGGTYSGDDGLATNAGLNCPNSTAVDAAGNIYIADALNNVVRKVDRATGVITTVAGNGTADYTGDSGPATSAALNVPVGVAVDSAGNLYIADLFNNVVRKVDTSGTITALAASLDWPNGVAVDPAGNVFIAVGNDGILEVVHSTGDIVSIAGTAFNWNYSGDGGPATAAALNFPTCVTVDSQGDLMIADNINNLVREVGSVAAVATTVSLASPASAATYGQSVTFTATVCPPYLGGNRTGGTVEFYDGNTCLATVNVVSAQATFSTSSLALGTHAITAVYSGDDFHAASTSDELDVEIDAVASIAITSNPTPQTDYPGGPIIFTAAAASAEQLAVQWQVSTNCGASFGDISGATSTTLTICGDPSENGDLYRAVFTGTSDGITATTSAASLTVLPDGWVVNSTADHDWNGVSYSPWTGYFVTIGGLECCEYTLKSAIEYFNAHGGGTIDFGIPTTDPNYSSLTKVYTITTELPEIDKPMIIDGSSEFNRPGHLDLRCKPDIDVVAKYGGFTVSAGPSTINALAVTGTCGTAITIDGACANKITNCYLGILPDGETAGGSIAGYGVEIAGAGSNNLNWDVISGNDNGGIYITNSSSNTITGCEIGTNSDGTAAVPNQGDGVLIDGGSQYNTVGGAAISAMNVISGNAGNGVTVDGSSMNQVQGNYIGMTPGYEGLGNTGDGVMLRNGASANLIGGNSTTGQGNVILANSANGVEIGIGSNGTAASNGNYVEGNYIGTNLAADNRLGNTMEGVLIGGGSQNNIIGGAAAGWGNVIAANKDDGVLLAGSNTKYDYVWGNWIGTNWSGSSRIGNTNDGVAIQDGAGSDTVGGNAAGDGNVICKNGGNGVTLDGSNATFDVIAGNWIGTDSNSTPGIGDTKDGVDIRNGARLNTVGGSDPSYGNVIAQNGGDGVAIVGNAAAIDGSGSGNVVAANWIGTDKKSSPRMGNTDNGVSIMDNACGNNIGGPDSNRENVIAANLNGVFISGATANYVQANYIGTDARGAANIGNRQDGVLLVNSGSCGIGATGASPTQAEGNVICRNSGNGVHITGSSAYGDVVAGNCIGTDPNGDASLGNSLDGVLIDGGASTNYIGTNAVFTANCLAVQANTISCNLHNGVRISDSSTNGNTVAGDDIELNLQGGIRIENGANANVIGSSPSAPAIVPLAGDTIAHNGAAPATGQTGAGVAVVFDTSVGNSILGNSIFGNDGLGIDLGDDGPTPNYGVVSTSGPNCWQNSPTITSVVSTESNGQATTDISGTLSGARGATYRIELFTNDGGSSDWNQGGTTLIDDFSATADQYGQVTFARTETGTLQYVTATAASLGSGVYNTSEFSYYLGTAVHAVTFSATNSAEFNQITPDPTVGGSGIPYGNTKQWEMGTDPQGQPAIANDYPLCYTRSGTAAGDVIMTTQVTINVPENLPSGTLVVSATGPSLEAPCNIGTFTEQGAPTYNASAGTITATLRSNALPSVVAAFPLTLDWSVSVNGGTTWVVAGSTQNQVYITWATPIAPGFPTASTPTAPYESCLFIGCNAASGVGGSATDTSQQAALVTTLWDNSFATCSVSTVGGTVMQYSHVQPVHDTVQGMLEWGTGQCDAWADLLNQTLAAQGITSAIYGIIASHPNYTKFAVKAMPAQGTGGTPDPDGTLEQDGFGWHAVVLLNCGSFTIFDPSYGSTTSGSNWDLAEQAYDDAYITDVWNGSNWVQHTVRTMDVLFVSADRNP